MFNQLLKIKSYLREAQHEFKRVNWPSRNETLRLTLIVIGISIAVALFLGFLDFIFGYLLERIIV